MISHLPYGTVKKYIYILLPYSIWLIHSINITYSNYGCGNISKYPHKYYVHRVTLQLLNLYSKSWKFFELILCMLWWFTSYIKVLWVSLGQRAAKLWSVKLWRWYLCLGVKPGLTLSGSTLSEQQNLFQTLNFDSW